ncbi:hypothetical protein Tco_0757463 [Tanacetum coccineum]
MLVGYKLSAYLRSVNFKICGVVFFRGNEQCLGCRTEDRQFASRISVLLQEMIAAYDDKMDFIQELEAVPGVSARVKTAKFLNETLWKDDKRLRKLRNMEMDANEQAVQKERFIENL